MNLLSGATDNRRTTQMILMAIIVLTLPCYCLGAVLLAYAPDSATPRSGAGSPTLGGITQTPLYTPSFTPFFTYTPTTFSGTLRATAPPLYLPPNTAFYLPPTNTPFPTWTSIPTLTPAPTLTLIPSPTLAPSPTSPPLPTDTLPPTDIPAPTQAPLPTDEPPPTQEVLDDAPNS